jgi:hypothetical protein
MTAYQQASAYKGVDAHLFALTPLLVSIESERCCYGHD